MTEALRTATDAASADAAREHAAWRAERENDLRAPHGWLSLTGLLWPTAEPGRLPGLPGEWWVAEGSLHTRPAPGDATALRGELVAQEGSTSVTVAEGRSLVVGTFVPEDRPDGAAPDAAQDTDDAPGPEHEVAVEVVRRTGRYGLRPRDPRAATRAEFTGVPAFDHDPAWVLDAAVTWYDEPRRVTVGAARPRLVHHVQTVGEVEVVHGGTVTTLALTGTPAAPTLLFSDEADGVAPWRVLEVTAPAPAGPDEEEGAAGRVPGSLRLDLNRAINLPYAFTEFGTCPAPVAGNHLPFAVTAGEKAPR